MTFDPTKPVQTVDGRSARILCTDRKASRCETQTVVALVTEFDQGEYVRYYDADGTSKGYSQGTQLVNIPVRRSEWYTKGKQSIMLWWRDEQNMRTFLKNLNEPRTILEFCYEDDKLVEVKIHE